MKNQLKTTKPKPQKERRHIDWGRFLFTGFLCVTMLAGSATQVFAAPTVWEKATEIMKDVYSLLPSASFLYHEEARPSDRGTQTMC